MIHEVFQQKRPLIKIFGCVFACCAAALCSQVSGVGAAGLCLSENAISGQSTDAKLNMNSSVFQTSFTRSQNKVGTFLNPALRLLVETFFYNKIH